MKMEGVQSAMHKINCVSLSTVDYADNFRQSNIEVR